MKLYKYIHYNESTKTLDSNEVSKDAFIKLEDDAVVPVDYTLDNTILNWDEYGESLCSDFLQLRTCIYGAYTSTTFANLTLEEKEIISKYFLAEKTDRDTVHTEQQQLSYWKNFVVNSVEARATRWNVAKLYVSYVLPPANSIDIGLSAEVLSNEYQVYGIEDFATDGVDGLFDYLEGTSAYTTNGFPSKSYWTQEIQDAIMNILKDGNY